MDEEAEEGFGHAESGPKVGHGCKDGCLNTVFRRQT